MARKSEPAGIKIIAKNKRARHEYEIFDTWEAGLVLMGTEVKALRNGRVNLGDSYGEIREGEAWIAKMHIGPYEMGNRENHEPFRRRKMLLTRREIRKIRPKVEEQGLTLVPLQDLFQEGSGEDRDRAGPRQETSRQEGRQGETGCSAADRQGNGPPVAGRFSINMQQIRFHEPGRGCLSAVLMVGFWPWSPPAQAGRGREAGRLCRSDGLFPDRPRPPKVFP